MNDSDPCGQAASTASPTKGTLTGNTGQGTSVESAQPLYWGQSPVVLFVVCVFWGMWGWVWGRGSYQYGGALFGGAGRWQFALTHGLFAFLLPLFLLFVRLSCRPLKTRWSPLLWGSFGGVLTLWAMLSWGGVGLRWFGGKVWIVWLLVGGLLLFCEVLLQPLRPGEHRWPSWLALLLIGLGLYALRPWMGWLWGWAPSLCLGLGSLLFPITYSTLKRYRRERLLFVMGWLLLTLGPSLASHERYLDIVLHFKAGALSATEEKQLLHRIDTEPRLSPAEKMALFTDFFGRSRHRKLLLSHVFRAKLLKLDGSAQETQERIPLDDLKRMRRLSFELLSRLSAQDIKSHLPDILRQTPSYLPRLQGLSLRWAMRGKRTGDRLLRMLCDDWPALKAQTLQELIKVRVFEGGERPVLFSRTGRVLRMLSGKDFEREVLVSLFRDTALRPGDRQRWLPYLRRLLKQPGGPRSLRPYRARLGRWLLKHLRQKREPDRRPGLRLLASFGTYWSEWREALQNRLPPGFFARLRRAEDPRERRLATEITLSLWSSSFRREEQLLQALQDPSQEVQRVAWEHFPRLQEQRKVTAPTQPFSTKLRRLLLSRALRWFLKHPKRARAPLFRLIDALGRGPRWKQLKRQLFQRKDKGLDAAARQKMQRRLWALPTTRPISRSTGSRSHAASLPTFPPKTSRTQAASTRPTLPVSRPSSRSGP